MFSFSFGELILIAVIALIFIGPNQLPGLARTIGKFYKDFRRATDEVRGAMLGAQTQVKEYSKVAENDVRNLFEGDSHKVQEHKIEDFTIANHHADSTQPHVSPDESQLSLDDKQLSLDLSAKEQSIADNPVEPTKSAKDKVST